MPATQHITRILGSRAQRSMPLTPALPFALQKRSFSCYKAWCTFTTQEQHPLLKTLPSTSATRLSRLEMPTSAPPSRLREAGMERPLAQRLRSRFVEQNGEVCVAKDVSGHIAWQAHDVPCRPEGLLATLQEGFVALKEEFRKDGGLDERVEKWMEEVEEPVGDEVESREAAQPETTGSTEEQPPGEEEAVAAKTCDDVDMSFASWTMW